MKTIKTLCCWVIRASPRYTEEKVTVKKDQPLGGCMSEGPGSGPEETTAVIHWLMQLLVCNIVASRKTDINDKTIAQMLTSKFATDWREIPAL